ncbi:dihydrolipoamide acetyltransferase family protein [Hydrogenimonas cancrithermarum]|uniref:Dihydrolipoamide acetyltransferase component of pyruvate dehydrogenase complex n=1 Tax=Hydrogenimonas cancrithermarum TaxID=2993563 RepID=A0ABN6WUE1_9BACT|nr:dihydrolipoamide acetyltransferase family protein [Hydrogenimonas cancrithermarum]BDY11752.1 acetyltransferase component of pyruvate dehydrogenase complex [Hydrogenimonas cancrithermarum]
MIYKMPSLGADMESGILAEWKVKEGDRLKKGDVIADIETSKGIIEAEIYEDGTVEKIVGKEGTEYPVGTPLAVVRTEKDDDETIRKELAEVEAAAGGEAPKEEGAAETVFPSSEKEEQTASAPKSAAEEIFGAIAETKDEAVQEVGRIRATPLARKRARELGIDLKELAKRVRGKISARDVEEVARQLFKPGAAKPDAMRMAIAAAMSRSNAEIPHYYLSTPIDMTSALSWLRDLNAKRSIKDRILPAALMIRAVVEALKEVPELNGFWKEGPVPSEAIHPGIAIARREGGLITPAMIDAHKMNLDETMQALSDLITRTRGGKLTSSQMTEQTVTITNLGDLGVEKVFGVIYPPQVALIGFGRIMERPWAVGDAIAVRKVVEASIAGDHRATDGRTGALFLAKLDKILQNPEELL